MTSLNKDEEWFEKEVDEMFTVGNIKFSGLVNDKCTPQGVKDLCHKLAHKIKEDIQKEVTKDVIGNLGAKLLAKHSSQAVLDAYFEVANEELEKYESDN
jgi:DNA-binding cell septation regulator SpoVG